MLVCYLDLCWRLEFFDIGLVLSHNESGCVMHVSTYTQNVRLFPLLRILNVCF